MTWLTRLGADIEACGSLTDIWVCYCIRKGELYHTSAVSYVTARYTVTVDRYSSLLMLSIWCDNSQLTLLTFDVLVTLVQSMCDFSASTYARGIFKLRPASMCCSVAPDETYQPAHDYRFGAKTANRSALSFD